MTTKNDEATKSYASRKITISISKELNEALNVLSIRFGSNKSRAVETILRENKYIDSVIKSIRSEELGIKDGLYAAKSKQRLQSTKDRDRPDQAKEIEQ